MKPDLTVVPEERDPHVRALQRSDDFAPALLADSQWLDGARKKIRQNLKDTPHSKSDEVKSLGIELAFEAYLVAEGYAAGQGILDDRVMAARRKASDGSSGA